MVYSFHWDCTIHLSFISQILLSTYNVPDTILGAAVNKDRYVSALLGICIPGDTLAGCGKVKNTKQDK